MTLPLNLATGAIIDEPWVDAVVDELTALPSRYLPLVGYSVESRSRRRTTDATQAVAANAVVTLLPTIVDVGPAMATGVYTVTKAGLHHITLSGSWDVVPSVRSFGSLVIASTVTGLSRAIRNSGTGEDSFSVHVSLPLAIGDTITAGVFQGSGATRFVPEYLLEIVA